LPKIIDIIAALAFLLPDLDITQENVVALKRTLLPILAGLMVKFYLLFKLKI
jgi:hypothetical protein